MRPSDARDVLGAFDQAPAAIGLYEGADLRLRYCNAANEALVGHPLELGKTLTEVLPELQETDYPDVLAHVLATGETVLQEQVWLTLIGRPEGQQRVMLSLSLAPWRGADARVRGVLVTLIDITAHEQARVQVEAGDARLRAMANALPHGIFICEPSGKMRYVNERWKELTGYTSETFSRAAWAHMIHPEDLPLVRTSWHRSTTHNGTFDVYARIRHRTATAYRWQQLMGRCYAEQNADDLVWVCSWTDVHERMVNEMARATSRKQFIASLSHDLRAPLAGIRASVENMQRKVEAARPFERKFERIVQAVDQADDMLQSLLDIDRITSEGADHLAFSPLNLGRLLRDAVDNHKAVHGERCVAHLPTDVQGYWHGPSLIRAVDNLLGNAFKYGAPDGQVTLTLRHDTSWCHIAVHNTGNPIPEAEQPRIFMPYERGQAGSIKGWGLGLSMVAGVARAHQGRITVDSSAQAGTTFTLSFPKGSGQQKPGPGVAAVTQQAAVRRGGASAAREHHSEGL